jgi:MFS family permease
VTPDAASPTRPPDRFPLWPLMATLAVQTLATMAAYTVPALAPMIARDLGVEGALVGYYVAMVYGVGIASSLLAPSLIHAYGAVRVSQVIVLSAIGMPLVASLGSLGALAASAAVLGFAYGATAPSSTHLLVPLTPPRMFNFVMSLRQIGVPLGGVLGALTMPPVAIRWGWQAALLTQLVPLLALLVALEVPRRRWDRPRPSTGSHWRSLGAFLPLMREDGRIARLVAVVFVYSGTQLTFVAFMTVHLTTAVGLGLVAAAQGLATYQIAGAVSRPIWGWLADRFVGARWLLVGQGFVMAAAAVAAGQFDRAWSLPAVLAVAVIAGATASGYTGIAYAEFARLAGERRTEATGLGSASMFAGVMVVPSLASLVVVRGGTYTLAYSAIAILALAAAILLAACRWAKAEPVSKRHGA